MIFHRLNAVSIEPVGLADRSPRPRPPETWHERS